MGYIEDRKVELLKDQESWVRARIGEVMDARAEIDMGFASGDQHPKVVSTGLPVGYADALLK